MYNNTIFTREIIFKFTAGTLAPFVPGRLEFTGPGPAELFTKEIAESLEGVLTQNFVYDDHDPFVRSSIKCGQ